MAFAVFPTISASVLGPSFPYNDSHAPRTLEAKFGDGYSQTTVDGINTDESSNDVTWTNLYTTEKDVIINFLSGLKGATRFTFTPPFGSPQTFSCPKWSATSRQGNVWDVQATFIRRFDVG